jgi:hypothetical protein
MEQKVHKWFESLASDEHPIEDLVTSDARMIDNINQVNAKQCSMLTCLLLHLIFQFGFAASPFQQLLRYRSEQTRQRLQHTHLPML